MHSLEFHNVSTLHALHYTGLVVQQVEGEILGRRGPPSPGAGCGHVATRVLAAEELPLPVTVGGIVLGAYP